MCKPGIIIVFVFLALFVNGQTNSEIVTSNNQFAFELLKEISNSTPKSNLFFSPFSIFEALAMTYAGAKNYTEKEMQQVLHLPGNQGAFHNDFSRFNSELSKNFDSVTFELANSLWAQQDYNFLPDYLNLISVNYNSPVNLVNYKKTNSRKKAVTEINKYVNETTNGNISDFIKINDISEETRLLIVNAVWFFGEWHKAFNSADTKKSLFYSQSGEQSCMFMNQKGKFHFYEDDILTAAMLPYKGLKQSFIVLLPNNNDGLEVLEKNLDDYYLSNILKDMIETPLNLSLPKISSSFSLDLANILKHMGMSEAFTDNADFSGMTQKNDLKIDKILHQAKVELTEKGTEAAASTAVIMVRKSAIIEREFTANRPFVYLIYDNETGTILFLGKLAKVE